MAMGPFNTVSLTYTANKSKLNISAANVVTTNTGHVASISVITAGSTPGTVNDVATTGGAATANEVFVIPNTVGRYPIDFPFFNGLVIVPGTGQVVAVSYA